MLSSALKVEFLLGKTLKLPPERPFPKYSLESPSRLNLSPLQANAPKLCPALPLKLIVIVSSGRPFAPYFLVISELIIVPTVLL